MLGQVLEAVNNFFTGISGMPDLPSLVGPGVNINSRNNISIQTGPNNIPPSQSSSVGNNGGPASCTP